MGTDAGTPLNHHGRNAQELEYMVDIGIAPMDAITIATSHAADLMRIGDRGRIREGAVADLLVVEGNPVDDIDAVADAANHRFVVKGGRVLTGKAGRTELRPATPLAAAS